jgi:signal transduction histidine kinase
MVMAAATGAAVALVTEPARVAVSLCGALGTLLVLGACAETVRRGRVLKGVREQYRRHIAEFEAHIAARDQLSVRIAKELLPKARERMRSVRDAKKAVEQVCSENPAFHTVSPGERELLVRCVHDIAREIKIRESSARAFVSLTRRVQSIVYRQASELREMEYDHGRNPQVFNDLLRIDHGNALIGRLTDSITILHGSQTGRQWDTPIKVYSALRGAMSRIQEYPRINLKAICDASIKGLEVEAVIHACAELLDNATRYSPPQTKVHVTAVEVQTGIAIEIEDGGVTFSDEQRRRVETLLDRAQNGFELDDLGEEMHLGLPLVGKLCAEYGMTIGLRQSAYGGVRAVLVVPHSMISEEQEPDYFEAHGIGAIAASTYDGSGTRPLDEERVRPKKRRPTTGPRPSAPLLPLEEDDEPVVTEWRENGLPQRRRKVDTKIIENQIIVTPRNPDLSVPPPAAAPPQHERPAEPEQEETPPGLWVDAFWDGLKRADDEAAARAADGTDKPNDDTYDQQAAEGDRQ